jgi:hypothetical protein
MEKLTKFARGEMGLAKTFWLGYIGVSVAMALFFAALMTFIIPGAGGFLMLVVLAWAVFASWAVVNAAGYTGSRSTLGWVATIYVVLVSGWAIISVFRIYVLGTRIIGLN